MGKGGATGLLHDRHIADLQYPGQTYAWESLFLHRIRDLRALEIDDLRAMYRWQGVRCCIFAFDRVNSCVCVCVCVPVCVCVCLPGVHLPQTQA